LSSGLFATTPFLKANFDPIDVVSGSDRKLGLGFTIMLDFVCRA